VKGYFLARRAASAPPVLLRQQEVELHGLPLTHHPNDSSQPPTNEASSVQAVPKRVCFQEAVERVPLADTVVGINRGAFSDMRMAQQDLERQMSELQKRVNFFPKGDAQDLVRDALRCDRAAVEERVAAFDRVQTLLRGQEVSQGKNTSQELNRKLFCLKVAIGGVDRTLKTAQEEMTYLSLPDDEGIKTIRATLKRYRGAIDQLVSPMEQP
jgi:hypothetical protein